MSEIIYLSSASPRRRELLTQLSIKVELIVAPIDEIALPNEKPLSYVERMACLKAQAGWQRVVREAMILRPLLAADTAVIVDDLILGKPKDIADARAMLRLLSGRKHRVISSVALCVDGKINLRSSVSEVAFCYLSSDDIEQYLLSKEPFGKAGSYAIQGKAARFISCINGSFSGVVGLPLFETAELLTTAGYLFSS